jgi:formylglycine-generating enzyme required for sulfatase activity
MGKTEVTNEAYERYQNAFLHRISRQGAPKMEPAANLTRDDAQAFCRWAGGDLPSEAQWEYASKAGSSIYHERQLARVAWYNDNDDLLPVQAVGLLAANKFGLSDMLGNVAEWVHDGYDPFFYTRGPSIDPVAPQDGRNGVVRGGSSSDGQDIVNSTFRIGVPSTTALPQIGFRCIVPVH